MQPVVYRIVHIVVLPEPFDVVDIFHIWLVI